MDLKTELAGRLQVALQKYLAAQAPEAQATVPEFLAPGVEAPKNPEHGDFSSNIAMQLTRHLKRNPMEIAGEFLAVFDGAGLVREASVAAPGFINFRMESAAAASVLERIAREGTSFGRTSTGAGTRVLVEFVSANPTGPLHVGHARNAVVGDILARLLDASGHAVSREYYFNDAGVQMNMLGETLRMRVHELLGQKITWPDQFYRGDYMAEIAQRMIAECGSERLGGGPGFEALEYPACATPGPALCTYTDYAVREILKTIDADMQSMGIVFDTWFSETTLHKSGAVAATLEDLRARGRIYEQDGAQWLRTTEYGDEKDRVVVKSDGNYTYVMPDIAYHRDKYARGFDRLINVLGGDHHGYVPRLRAAVAALGHPREALQCVIIQMVALMRDGAPMKLSTRGGEFVTFREMIEELGVGVVRFFFAMRSPDSQMVFDWNLAQDTSMDNPVYYVQYACARCASLFRKAEESGCAYAGVENADLGLLAHPAEQALLRCLARLPEVVDRAAQELAPPVVTQYLHDAAQLFHAYFTLGGNDPALRMIQPGQPALTQARLALIDGLRTVLSNALRVLGIEPLDRM